MGSPVHVWLAAADVEPRVEAHALLLALASTLVHRPSLHHDAAGRPHVPGLAVSLSRTHNLIAAAASYHGPLGVDLEKIRPHQVAGLARRWFHAAELRWMCQQPDELLAFLQLWTAKEAVGKALGHGLRNSGLRRRMPLAGGEVDSAPGLRVSYVPCDAAVLAVAAPTGFTEIVVRHPAQLQELQI